MVVAHSYIRPASIAETRGSKEASLLPLLKRVLAEIYLEFHCLACKHGHALDIVERIVSYVRIAFGYIAVDNLG